MIVQDAGGSQHGAAFAGQPQGFAAEGRIIERLFRGKGFFHRFGKLAPCSKIGA